MNIHPKLQEVLTKENIKDFRPAQKKALKAGLLEGESQLICTPTASGKTLVAELASINSILNNKGKAIYIVPLKALATEKYKEFQRKYSHLLEIALSIGDLDESSNYLNKYDLIICTSEKLDSLLRHHAPWLKEVATIIIDEVHLLNDISRGPTLEIIITLLKSLLKNIQIIALSATIGNPKELAEWLDAELIIDTWRPVELKKAICFDNEITYY